MNITLTKDAVKAIERMDAPTRARIYDAINKLPAGDVKKLKGFATSYRIRVGDLRVIFDMVGFDITIDEVLPRGDAYK